MDSVRDNLRGQRVTARYHLHGGTRIWKDAGQLCISWDNGAGDVVTPFISEPGTNGSFFHPRSRTEASG